MAGAPISATKFAKALLRTGAGQSMRRRGLLISSLLANSTGNGLVGSVADAVTQRQSFIAI
jgi:hypothetical protein